MSKVDNSTVDMMAGSVWNALYGPTGVVHLLPDEERQMLFDTEIVVEDKPSKRDLALVAEDVGADGKLLGLFTHPPSKIQLFASSIIAVGYDPVDVATHELGHRLNYDHSLRKANVALVGRREGPAEARVLISGDSCPVCLLHSRLADVVMLLDGLRKRAHLQHEIPLGLGGTIPLAAKKTAEARSNLALIATSMPNRQGEIRELDSMLDQLQHALAQHLTPEAVSAAYILAYRAWDRAYDLNHAYWLQTIYGSAILSQGVPHSHSEEH